MRIFKGERHDLCAAVPCSTTTLSLEGRVGGSAFTPKVIELVFGPGSTRLAEKLSPCTACTALAARTRESCRLRARLPPWQDVAAERPAPGLLHADPSNSYVLPSIIHLPTSSSILRQYTPSSVGWPDPNSFCWGTRPLPSGTASLSFRGILGKPLYQGILIGTSVLRHPRQREDQEA